MIRHQPFNILYFTFNINKLHQKHTHHGGKFSFLAHHEPKNVRISTVLSLVIFRSFDVLDFGAMMRARAQSLEVFFKLSIDFYDGAKTLKPTL